jgi:hypothetical protein
VTAQTVCLNAIIHNQREEIAHLQFVNRQLKEKNRRLSDALDHAERALLEHGDDLCVEQIDALLDKIGGGA